MCNSVIRPVRSYATVDIVSSDETATVKRGEFILVKQIQSRAVIGYLNGDDTLEVSVPLDVFIHSFTANSKDLETARKEESKWFDSKSRDTKK